MRRLHKYRYLILCTVLVVVSAFGYILYERKTIHIMIDGEEKVLITHRDTLGEVFKDEKISIDPRDKVDRELNTKIKRNETVSITKAVNITVAVDGKELKFKTAESDISAMLKAEGIQLGEEDKVSPALDTRIVEGTTVDITRVETKTVTEKVAIDYQKIVENDANLLATQSKVRQKGENGEKQVTYKVIYENGKEASKEVIGEVILKQPVKEILIKGSLPVFSVSRGEYGPNYYKEIVVKSTAYYAVNGIGKTYTASGRKAVRDPHSFSTIAVDPTVIPLGTKVYVEGYGYAIAADKGEVVKGNFIDVFFDTHREASSWGVKYVKVYFLR